MAGNLDQVSSVNNDGNGNNPIPRLCVTFCHFPQDNAEVFEQVSVHVCLSGVQ